jgi:hypothetical protein
MSVKNARLIKRVVELAAGTAKPERHLVMCASKEAADGIMAAIRRYATGCEISFHSLVLDDYMIEFAESHTQLRVSWPEEHPQPNLTYSWKEWPLDLH